MFKNFFEARDVLDREVLDDPEPIRNDQRAAFAVFRLLLEHTLYTLDKKTAEPMPSYGWVAEGDRKMTSIATIARLAGYSERQVKTALGQLAEWGFIERYAVRTGKPGSRPDRIKITWGPMWPDDEDEEAVLEAVQVLKDNGLSSPDLPETGAQDSDSAVSAPSVMVQPLHDRMQPVHSLEGAAIAPSYSFKEGLEEDLERPEAGNDVPENQTPKTHDADESGEVPSEELILARKKKLVAAQERLSNAEISLAAHPPGTLGPGGRQDLHRYWTNKVRRCREEVEQLEAELGESFPGETN